MADPNNLPPDQRFASAVGAQLGGMDSAKAAGLVVIGAVVVLSVLRRSFGGVRVNIGD